jgi:hypothetical protein
VGQFNIQVFPNKWGAVLTQLVQLVEICTQVAQGESQTEHKPFLITSGKGQLAMHIPLYNAAIVAQLVQLLTSPVQLKQTVSQESQVFKTVLIIVIFKGHVFLQVP